MKHKTGSIVKVKEGLIVGVDYGQDGFVKNMERFIGREMTIDRIEGNYYIMKEDPEDWGFTEEMIVKEG